MNGYIKSFFSLFFFICTTFNSHESHAIDIKKCWRSTADFLYKTFIIRSVPAHLAVKRKLQLAAAIQRFKERTKKNLFSSNASSSNSGPASAQQLSQTEAYMHRFKNEIHFKWGFFLQKYDAMIQKIIAREKEHSETHYVFYHAHRSTMRIIHDVIQELYRFFFQQAHLEHFKCVRFWKDYSKFSTAHAFLNYYKKSAFGSSFDCDASVAQQLLCVNLSLFGNRTFGGEGTFDFFLWNTSFISGWFQSYLEELFYRLGIEEKWAQPLMNLAYQELNYSADPRGQILQIFIPKKDVDSYVYASKAYGIPHGPIAAAPANIAFNATLNRHTSIVPILESYQKNPFEMDATTYDFIQGRLILTSQIFEPKSNVKIYRYSSIPKEKIKAYKQRLREIMATALEQWCTTYATQRPFPQDLSGTAIDELLATIA